MRTYKEAYSAFSNMTRLCKSRKIKLDSMFFLFFAYRYR